MTIGIISEHIIYGNQFEADGIYFYATSTNRKDIEGVVRYLEMATPEEEKQIILVLKKLHNAPKPSDDSWRVAICDRDLEFYLDGYNIMVMLP